MPSSVADGQVPNRTVPNKLVHRPFSMESNIRSPRKRRDSVKPPDAGRAAKRSRIIFEFYDTEQAYVDGLELIYSVNATAPALPLESHKLT
jgi:hypothetical protein